MLSTKDMSAGSGSIKPVIGPGNQVIKINSITFDVTPYDADAYNTCTCPPAHGCRCI